MKNKIIQYLKESEGFLSGEEISRRCNISRSAIWKNITELKKEGYEFEALRNNGYKLVGIPDKLFTREIQDGLKTDFIGQNIIHFDEVSSTMDEAFRLGVEGAREGTVVCAETQTKGRGRMGRSWVSPKGKGVYVSVILRPELSPADLSQLTLLSAVVVCEALRNATGIDASIKWPNDILIKGKKIAGILTELNAEVERVHFVVVGVGINVNTPKNLLVDGATSLKVELKKHIDRIRLTQELLVSFENWYMSLKKYGFTPAISEWKRMSATLGQKVKIQGDQGEHVGEAVDLDEFGRLMVRNEKGVIVKQMTGDVILI